MDEILKSLSLYRYTLLKQAYPPVTCVYIGNLFDYLDLYIHSAYVPVNDPRIETLSAFLLVENKDWNLIRIDRDEIDWTAAGSYANVIYSIGLDRNELEIGHILNSFVRRRTREEIARSTYVEKASWKI